MTTPTWQPLLGTAYRNALLANGDRPAVSCAGRTWTYADLAAKTGQASRSLSSAGVGRGDRVALMMRNKPDYFAWDIAIALLGAVKVPFNTALAAPQMDHMLAHAEVETIVADPDLVETLWANGTSDPALYVVLPAVIEPTGREAQVPEPVRGLDADDLSVIYYTGGTTGLAKGVAHSQRTVLTNLAAQALEGEILSDDRMLLTTPLSHAAGLFAAAGLLRGAHLYVEESFSVPRVMELCADEAITWTFAVPTMIYRLLDQAQQSGAGPLMSLRTVVYGAAPMMPQRLREGLDLLGPVFIQLYGQTECPNWGTRLSKDAHQRGLLDERLLKSCGAAATLAEIRIIDPEGREVPTGGVGEICLRSPYTMLGYHKNPEATAARLTDDGWLSTGDIGYVDPHGFVFLQDRNADMIISGGLNVYSTEVERALLESPAISQAAVIGIPDADWGEAVHALVVAKPGMVVDSLSVLADCANKLAKYQVPKTVEVVDELPTTPFGKIDKKLLREPHWGTGERQIN